MHTQIYMQLTRSLQMVVITDNGLGGLSVIDCIWQSITIYYRVCRYNVSGSRTTQLKQTSQGHNLSSPYKGPYNCIYISISTTYT